MGTRLGGYKCHRGAGLLLRPLPEDRTLFVSCTNRDKCLASIKGYEKYIHHYGDQPDEFFDLSEDPLEKRNLAAERAEEAKKRRDELLAWRYGSAGTAHGAKTLPS